MAFVPGRPQGVSRHLGARGAITVRGANKVTAALKRFDAVAQMEVLRALEMAGLVVEAEAKKLLSEGALKAVDTGRLRASITTRLAASGGFARGDPEAQIGTNVHYAIYVHEGTPHMNPRPFLLTALINKQKQVEAIVAGAIKRSMMKGV